MRTEVINGMTVHMPDKKHENTNLSPQEILSNKAEFHQLYHSDILSVMEQYAKQQALLFTTFRERYQKEEKERIKKEQERVGGIFSWIGTPDNIIYDKFIEQQKNNE